MSEVLRGSTDGAAEAAAQPKPQPDKAEAAPGEDDEQHKYHQQMLYPTPGLRNYGFSDSFMIHTFKVEPCRQQEKHARGSCPYAHPGDVAQRRPPGTYQALLCPEVRAKKVCPRANDCQCSHSAFEFWLHPDRYRTSMCEKGERCSRPVCFFAHNEKELRPLPAGLKPAVMSPEETAKRQGSSRPGSFTGMMQPPADAAGTSHMYMQGYGAQGGMAPHRPQLPMMGQQAYSLPGYGSAMQQAGYAQSAYPPGQVAYRGLQAPPALDVSQAGYGPLVGGRYVPQSPLMSPAAGLQPQGVPVSPVMLSGAPGAAAAAAGTQPRFSALAAGRNSTSGNGSGGGMWQQQQGRPGPGATTPTGGSMLPEAVMQQFSQLGVGAAPVTPAYEGAANGIPYAYETANSGLSNNMVQMPAAQYAQQQVVYMSPGMEQGWAQQQASLQQARRPQVQYSVPGMQYTSTAMDPQGTAQQAAVQQQMGGVAMMGAVMPAPASGLVVSPHQATGGALGMGDGTALTQQWAGAGGGAMRQPNPNAALQAGGMGGPGQAAGPNSFNGQGGW